MFYFTIRNLSNLYCKIEFFASKCFQKVENKKNIITTFPDGKGDYLMKELVFYFFRKMLPSMFFVLFLNENITQFPYNVIIEYTIG